MEISAKVWMETAQVDLESFSHWASLMGFVEARNSLQHGLGKLTEIQLGRHKDEVLRGLDSAGIQRNGDDLIISPANVSEAAKLCPTFILWLDVVAPVPNV